VNGARSDSVWEGVCECLTQNLRAGKSVVEDFTEEKGRNTTALFQYKLKRTEVPPHTQYQKHIFSYFKLPRLSFNAQRKCFLLKKQNKMTWLFAH